MKDFIATFCLVACMISGATFLVSMICSIVYVILVPEFYDMQTQASMFVVLYNSLIVLLPSTAVLYAIKGEEL